MTRRATVYGMAAATHSRAVLAVATISADQLPPSPRRALKPDSNSQSFGEICPFVSLRGAFCQLGPCDPDWESPRSAGRAQRTSWGQMLLLLLSRGQVCDSRYKPCSVTARFREMALTLSLSLSPSLYPSPSLLSFFLPSLVC